MAQSLQSDFKIYQAQFEGAFVETLVQNTMAFNAASRGAITLDSRFIKGNFEYENMWDVDSSLVTRRDTTDASAIGDTALTQDEFIGVKLDRKVGPKGVSLDAMKKQGRDPRSASQIIGAMAAKAVAVDQLNAGLLACEGALDAVTALEHDATDGTIATTDLASGLSKFGDAAQQIVAWVMHSKPFYDLVINQIATTGTPFAAWGIQILNGIPASLGRPIIVTDSSALVEAVNSTTTHYSTLGLTAGGIMLTLSETPTMVAELVTGHENMFYRIQGEHSYNVKLRGLKWKVASGNNPNDAALGLGSNWEASVTSNKNKPGVIIKSL